MEQQIPKEILIDVPQTLANLQKSAYKVSWSKFKAFRQCKASWFASNFVSFATKSAFMDEVKAVPGTIVQKIFEVFF